MAQALGLPLFESPWHMPRYPEGAVGRWHMQRGRVGLDRGCHSGPCVAADSAVLLRQGADDRWETWMSNVQAKKVYFWEQEQEQELVLGALACQRAQPSDGLCWTQAQEGAARGTGLPLLQ